VKTTSFMINFGEKIKKAFLTDKKNQGFFMSITWHFMSTSNVSLCTIFIICPIQKILCVGCIIYCSFVPNIITNI
jgi:hypothetical protein